jgi:hypothetical protein
VQHAANEIPDSNFRIAFGSLIKAEQREKSVVWPHHLMSGLLCLLLAGIAVDAVLYYLGIILWSL